MTTLHIENTVHDYDAWKGAFDKFDRARRERGVLAYRVTRGLDDPSRVIVDLDFDDITRAEDFREFLEGVWRTPQSQRVLAEHQAPVMLDVVEHRTLS